MPDYPIVISTIGWLLLATSMLLPRISGWGLLQAMAISAMGINVAAVAPHAYRQDGSISQLVLIWSFPWILFGGRLLWLLHKRRKATARTKAFHESGYAIRRAFITPRVVAELRIEADRVADEAGSTCVRHLRKRSELFLNFATSDILRPLLPRGMRPVRSILFDKTPDENWPVAWHQDLTITVEEQKEVEGYGPWSVKDGAPHVQPPAFLLENMVTLRIHLDPTPGENGALLVIPGSHLGGRQPSLKVSDEQEQSAITCACEPGDVLMMSPLILHASSRSTQPARRRILHFEYARDEDLDPALAWHEPN